MGTMLQQANLTADDFGGEQFEGCNEYLNVTAPDVIEKIHRDYLEAGADIIETNTFGGTRVVLDEYDLGDQVETINYIGAKLARKAADEYSTIEHPRFVAGSLGPTTKTLSVTGGITFDELQANYEEQVIALIKGGVDLLILETSQDTLNVKAAFNGISHAFNKLNKEVPLIISGTIEPMGTTLAGQTIEAFYISLEHMKPVAVGLNCATGPEFMTDHLRSLSELATSYVSCYPNAGLPDEEGHYHETPKSLAAKIAGFAEKGWLNIVGGCCGTTPEHIRAIKEAVGHYQPRECKDKHPHAISGIEPFVYDDPAIKPILVGERTNVIGSRKFKRLIVEEKYEEASEIARAQVKGGAHVIDVCLANPDRNELEDMEKFLHYVTKKIKAPLMIDSTDPAVIETALKYCQGKAIINSINLEDGEDRFREIVPLIKRYGAAVVVGTIDEKGMAITAEQKLAIAKRSYSLLVHKYRLNAQDLIFDPLVFPVGTGDKQYIGSAKETVDGIRLIKEQLPECQTILGVSNVSFGLPPVGREVLNAVYLYHCTKAGLDYAIVNTEKLERFASISEEEIKLAEDLLFETTTETLAKFTAFYRGKKKEVRTQNLNLSLEERLANYVVEGTKEGLIPDLERALQKFPSPLDIINGPLMDGMAEVGRLFNDNQLIVAEVLQSAEVMKTSVAFLEPYMEKSEIGHSKGKIVLATVKGDVHDIGKNLVDIILSNNGFEVVDLGIKVTSAELIEAVKKEKPHMIGLSGLLVKSAQQMVLTAQDLHHSNISIPILVGGAALTRKFTNTKIAAQYNGLVLYAKDAMEGLSLSNRVMDETERERLSAEQQEHRADMLKQTHSQQTTTTAVLERVRSSVSTTVPLFTPPDYRKHVLRQFDITQVEPYINMQMLIGHHLGLKGKVARLLEEKNEKAVKLKEIVDQLITKVKAENLLQPVAKYQFFPAQSDGDDIIIYSPEDQTKMIERFTFPRQQKQPYLCLADYLRSVDSGEMDTVGFLAVTAGKGVRELALNMKKQGQYLESHALQALALETAEGLAERVHQLMRDKWGFPDPTDFTMQDRFSAKYQGQRFSFGYPACPNLEDQEKLFQLLYPEEIGIHLTDGWMMDPEASVTAIVFAHPEARYFNVL
ncbi:methionine synthase [Bacillus aquiflavi]|uniref:Methionine synthase n=1 Tax=Bacillus aquiflavi TaxID=2672567 RepID=A0A6B3VYY0_9BACI|nr:methionine synthase [Bacillus aquiflavi]MBA4537856.1 methionine synthase [Bacillus aquiflavi]NEY82112.1 methionine synthase [Bacillus aquiflavi]UAC50157.1 methionine synthase [Bacillus aquiflavi]